MINHESYGEMEIMCINNCIIVKETVIIERQAVLEKIENYLREVKQCKKKNGGE